MAAPLVVNRLDDWFLPVSPSDSRLFHADSSDYIAICLPQVGQGYFQTIQLGDELTLLIHDYSFNQNVILDRSGSIAYLKCDFPLAGPEAGQSIFYPSLGLKFLSILPARQRFFEIEVIFQPPVLTTYMKAIFERLSPQNQCIIEQIIQAIYRYQGRRPLATPTKMIEQLINRARGLATPVNEKDGATAIVSHTHINAEQLLPPTLYAESMRAKFAVYTPITPEMERVIGQILSCPYQGATRRTYLERKAWELIALRLATMKQRRLLEAKLDYIDHAAVILSNQLANPPSIETLTREVSTNRFYLQQGFQKLYGTTPYGYLRECRLGQARRLLMTSDLSVSKVAAAVGYTNCSHFATAFRQQMGLNPKAFQLQVWKCAS
ncbi:MAG: AraC family transcriptional regulator [Cyanobacteria bacterium P01_B01_bin.77]